MDNAPKALVSILAAMALIGFIDNFVAVIAAEAGVWQFHFLRTAMSLPLFVALALLGAGRLRPRNWAGVSGRSAVMTVAMVLYFAALGVLPIAQAVAGLFTAPIFVLLLSAFVLRRPIGPVRIAAVAAGFLGTLLILRPDPSALSLWTAVPVVAGFFYAVGALATRSWCRDEDALTLTFASFVGLGIAGAAGLLVLWAVPMPGGTPFVAMGWVAPTAPFLFWTFVQAVGSIAAVMLIVRAYQLADASHVGIFEYSLLVFASGWAFVLKGETVDLPAALGMALIAGSGAAIALRTARAEAAA